MEIGDIVLIVRIAERILLTFFFLVSAAVIMIAYRQKVQSIDVNLSADVGALKTSASLIMPVFILLSVILFSFVVLLHPINLDIKEKDGEITSFVGYGSTTEDRIDLSRALTRAIDTSFRLQRAREQIPDDLHHSVNALGEATTTFRRIRHELLSEIFDENVINECSPKQIEDFAPIDIPECAGINRYFFDPM